MRINEKFSQSASYFMAIIILFALNGCFVGGSHGSMRFDELKYPASMSAYLYGPNNELLAKDRELRVIKRFSFKKNYWGTFYSLIPLTGTEDIGKQINAAIEESGGDGMINVEVTARPGFLTDMFLLNWLPVWPSFTEAVLVGEIVKYEPTIARNNSRGTVVAIPGDVRIIEASDQAVTIRLHEQCRAIGKAEAIPFRISIGGIFSVLKGIKFSDLGALGIFDEIKIKAQGKDANVAQVLFINSSYTKEARNATFLKQLSGDFNNAAVDIRYWSCPVQDAQ